MERDPQPAEVVCVGAGPVGLWTAVQTKILAPAAQVVLLEKYATYRRRNLLHLERTSLAGTPPYDPLRQLTASWPAFVPTADIETGLVALAQSLGVRFRQLSVNDVEQVKAEYPGVRVVVGSDGAHSAIRKCTCVLIAALCCVCS